MPPAREAWGKTKSIIVKYISRMKRNELLKRRKELKGTRIYINEDLTKINKLVFGIIRQDIQEPERVWVWEGKIFHKGVDQKIRQIPQRDYKLWIGPQHCRNIMTA